MIKWELHIREHGRPIPGITGVERNGVIYFNHPEREDEIVLRLSVDRANEIAAMDRHSQNKMNLRLERQEVFMGRDHSSEPLKTFQCPHCHALVTWIDSDFLLHSIPWCRAWREAH